MRISILTILILLSIYSNAQNISGNVSSNSIPLEGASAVLNKKNHKLCDEKGNFEFKGLKPGQYTLTLFHFGFEAKTYSINLSDGNEFIKVELRPLEKNLTEVIITDSASGNFGMRRMRAVEGMGIYEAKKSEVIELEALTANKAANNARQVYAKIPGLNIWESDGAGVQLGIGGRGLSPNRSSNFNTRQNGYDIAADALGYPESYYTPPVQAVERIEIVRGAASLQYGTQFGGLLNFKLKKGPLNEKVEFSSFNTYGSFNFYNSYNSIGGSVGRMNYYAYYNFRRSDGWRPNSTLRQHSAYTSFNFQLSSRLEAGIEYTKMTYLAKQAGGLTDNQFLMNPRQSNRERNWFAVDWNLFNFSLDYKLSPRLSFNNRFFGLIAEKDALGNLSRIDRPDDTNLERDLLSDEFRNWGNELRLIYRYKLLGKNAVSLLGSRYYQGYTERRQGLADNGFDADFTYINPDNLEGSAFDFPSRNVSAFFESIIDLNKKLSVTPGARFEYISTNAEGFYRDTRRDLGGNIIFDSTIVEDKSRTRNFVFFGIGLSYKMSSFTEIYSNFSQNYRAVNFNDIRVNNPSLEVDENLQDERGFNVDLGIRGTKDNIWNYDLSIFHLAYNDRIGTVLQTEPDPRFNNLIDRTFRLRTNIADARIFGLEFYNELNILALMKVQRKSSLNWFMNFAHVQSEYVSSEISGIEGKEVELVPAWNLKTGLSYIKSGFSIAYQLSYTSSQFSDASNAGNDPPVPTAVEGLIPAYMIMDLSAKYHLRFLYFEAGVNNLLDEMYFTRRAAGYPGPGIIPSDGRSFYLTLGFRIN